MSTVTRTPFQEVLQRLKENNFELTIVPPLKPATHACFYVTVSTHKTAPPLACSSNPFLEDFDETQFANVVDATIDNLTDMLKNPTVWTK